jgi:type IV pilus assembly protein PilE
MQRSISRSAGVTLVELLVTVTIVAIIMAVAYPSYQAQVQSGRRSDAKAELMRLAQYMERIYTENGCYDPGTTGSCGTGSPVTMPTGVDGYQFSFSAGPDGDSFTLRATPVAGGVQEGDGFLEINELGQRFWDEDDDKEVVETDADGNTKPKDGEGDWERG